MARTQKADLNSITNEQKKPTVTANSFTVDDDSTLATTDMYVDMLLQTDGLNSVMVAHNAAYTGVPFDSGLVQSSNSKLWFISSQMPVRETADTITVKHDGTPDGTKLRAVFLRDRKIVGGGNAIYVKLVTDNGGAGNTSFTTAGGLIWTVEDVDASTPGWDVRYEEGTSKFVINTTTITLNTAVYFVEPYTGNMVQGTVNTGVAKDVYIDPADTAADRLNADFTNTSDHTITMAAYSAVIFGAQVVPIYINPTASTQNRLQHSFSFVTDTLFINSLTTNEMIPVVYNATASADGYRLRWKTGSPFGNFCYNNTSTGTDTDTAFYTSTTLRRAEEVKA